MWPLETIQYIVLCFEGGTGITYLARIYLSRIEHSFDGSMLMLMLSSMHGMLRRDMF